MEAFDTMVVLLPTTDARATVLRHGCVAWGLDGDDAVHSLQIAKPVVASTDSSIAIGRVSLPRTIVNATPGLTIAAGCVLTITIAGTSVAPSPPCAVFPRAFTTLFLNALPPA